MYNLSLTSAKNIGYNTSGNLYNKDVDLRKEDDYEYYLNLKYLDLYKRYKDIVELYNEAVEILSLKNREMARTINSIVDNRMNLKDLKRVDAETKYKKVRLLDLDESQNPLKAARTRMTSVRSNSTGRLQPNTLTRSKSESTIKSIVKTFFDYDLNAECKPNRTVAEPKSVINSAYAIYRNTKSELLDHKPWKKPPTKDELKRMEIDYKKGMSMTTARTLEKNMRKMGVLNGEIAKMDLKRRPSIDFAKDVDLSEFTPVALHEVEELRKELDRCCKMVMYWIFNDDKKSIFKSIDVSGDGTLSVSEINNWFCRNRLKTNDPDVIKDNRKIIQSSLKQIDKNNDGYVTEDEFPMLYNFLRIYERLQGLMNESDNSDNSGLELEEFVKFAWKIGIKNRTLAVKMFDKLDVDGSGSVEGGEFIYAFTQYIIDNKLLGD